MSQGSCNQLGVALCSDLGYTDLSQGAEEGQDALSPLVSVVPQSLQMAELDLIAPGPLTGVPVHPLGPLHPDPGPAIPVEEDVDSLGKPGEETQGQGLDQANLHAPAPGEEGEEILCDFCLGASRVRAVKSCLTCMVNYCEEHLRPHQENSKLHSHQLTEPARDQDLRTCPAHHIPLTAFCNTHQQCICQQCGEGEHRGHDTVSLDAARRRREVSGRVSPPGGQREMVSPGRGQTGGSVDVTLCPQPTDKNFSLGVGPV